MAKKSLTRNYIYNMVYQILILVLPLVTTPYLSRVLGAEGIGIYSYTYAIVTYFILFGSLGVAMYGQREIAYAQENVAERKRVFIEIVLFRFVTIFLSTIVYFFFFIRGEQYQIYYTILLLELIAAAFDISWFFQGMEEFKRTVTRNVLVRVCAVTAVFIFVKKPEDLVLFTFIYSLADLLGNLSLWLYLPKYLKGVKIEAKVNTFRHIIPIILLFIPQIANQIYKILDTTMIGNIVADKSETGFYEQGQKVIRLLLTVVTSLGVVMVPRMASTYASGNKEQIRSYLKMSFRFVFFLAFPIMFGIASISEAFVPVFFGAGYDRVILLINVICPIILLMGIANVLGTQYLLPTKKQKEYTISVAIGLVFNFILNYILITKYQALGASIATVLSELIVVIIQYQYMKKEVPFKTLISLAWKYLIAGIVMFAVCFGVRMVLDIESLVLIQTNIANAISMNKEYFINVVSIVIQMILGALTYFIALVVLKDDYIFKFIDKIKAKIFKKEKVSE